MSLRRLITTVTALAVTAVVAAMGIIGYSGVRSRMRTELDSKLSATVAAFLRPGRGTAVPPAGLRAPAPPPFGGPPVYIQLITRDGTVVPLRGQAPSPPLPVDARARHIAITGSGRYFTDMTVDGVHVRVLTAGNRSHPWAVQAVRPLTELDSVLHGLQLTFAILVGAGIVLAVILGELVGRTALAPINRFIRSTEQVTGALDGSERLAEAGPTELARLASSFNRTLQALERSVQAQRHLVADASHELRTPIAALRSNVQIFLDSGRLPAGEAEALRAAIVAELDDLTQLVANVVDLARSAGPAARDDPLELIELDQVVADAIERTHRRAPHLRFEVSLEPTVIHNVPDRVGRAVANVLDNARKWSPPGGAVEVRLADGTLSVRDQGPGFDDKDVPYVFDRFYRAEQARRLPGSGLGLAIVHQAATARGGQVQAGNAPQGGALVRLNFGPPPAVNHRRSRDA